MDTGEASPSTAVNAYDAIAVRADHMDAMELWVGSPDDSLATAAAGSQSGLPSPWASLPLDNIHFVDSAQALSHVMTYVQHAPPAFLGVDLEWSDPYPVSLIQLATPTRVFVLDTVNRTPLYMSVLYYLIDWLFKQEGITKLFFGFPQDLVRLNMLFGPHGKTFGSGDHLASVIDLYMQRVRRIPVFLPIEEDTPLGREDLLGSALATMDFDKVQRVSATVPPHPPRERLAEQIFTVGGHHTLASMAWRFLGERLQKGYQTSNWNFRPLAASQVVYAATDAHVLLRLEAALREEGILPPRVWGCGPRDALQPAWWRPSMDE